MFLIMTKFKNNHPWQSKIGHQRDWIWRGWKIHYSYQPQKSIVNGEVNPPLVLIHGFGVSLKHWRNNVQSLAQHYPIYMIDLLGFGNSQKAYTTYGIDLWTDLIFDFWMTFISQPCILIGNSIGSLISLNTGVTYPQIMKGLVMLSLPDVAGRGAMIPPQLLSIVSTIEKIVANPLLVRLLLNIARQPNVIRKSLQTAYVNHLHVDQELVDLITTPSQDEGAARALIALTKSMTNFQTSVVDLLANLTVPTLLIWGQNDRLVPPTPAEKFAQTNKLIELKLLEQMGHCPHDESPETFNKLVIEWLRNLLSSGGIIPEE